MSESPDYHDMTKAEKSAFMKKRRGRNIAIALTVAGLCLLFYVVSIVRIGMNG